MNNGAISGNKVTNATSNGGGVYIAGVNNPFVMKGGSISGNTVLGRDGGGVFLVDSAAFIMTGGAISGNSAARYGGGVRGANSAIVTGTIYGREAAANLRNTASSMGAALYGYAEYGTFSNPAALTGWLGVGVFDDGSETTIRVENGVLQP
jgi:hypothetical protein